MHDKVMGGQSHTAGPWEAVRVDDVLAIMPDPITGRSDTFLGIAIVQEHEGERSARRVDANARLISAAPELLEALSAALAELEFHAPVASLGEIGKARKAIAKATGESAA